jgi:polygalacturonase
MYRKTYGPASIASTRRQLLGLTTVALATGLLPKALLASTPWSVGGEVVDVTTSPYNANPGLSDNTAAFQAALNYIASLSGGGTLVVPPGTYTFASSASGLTYTGGSSARARS